MDLFTQHPLKADVRLLTAFFSDKTAFFVYFNYNLKQYHTWNNM